MISYRNLIDDVRSADAALKELDPLARRMGLRPLAEWPFFKLLRDKLLPQLAGEPYVVAAVVGGTNVGKSSVFNALAGARVSGVSPLAAKTRHPVALVPPEFAARHDLGRVFPSFQVRPWTAATDPLEETEQHLLFWREHAGLPSNLVLCDTPDIDSVVRANWERAACIRRAADVLVAVLTGEKYNDYAVKAFFSEAASERKAVAVVFNRVDRQYDEQTCREWLREFLESTRVRPIGVYLAPRDRPAADAARLPIERRDWLDTLERFANEPDVSSEPTAASGNDPDACFNPGDARSARVATTPAVHDAEAEDGTERTEDDRFPNDLRRDLCELEFDKIKLLSIRGALEQLCDAREGVVGYENELRRMHDLFAEIGKTVATSLQEPGPVWPVLDWSGVMWPRVREAFFQSQRDWASLVHWFYEGMTEFVVRKPRRRLRKLWGSEVCENPRPFAEYREREWKAIRKLVTELFDCLIRVSRDHRLQSTQLAKVLREASSGSRRDEVLRRLKERHAAVAEEDIEKTLDAVIQSTLQQLATEAPGVLKRLNRLRKATAVIRPLVTVTAFAFISPLVAVPGIESIAIDRGIDAAVTVTADGLLGPIADKTTARAAEAYLRSLYTQFVAARLRWLQAQLEELALQDVVAELENARKIATHPALERLRRHLSHLEASLASIS